MELAYALLEQEEVPSWLCNVKKGATTILEEWCGMDAHTGSFNHYSYGAVCDFLFSRTAGIRPDGKRHPFAVICSGGAYFMVCSYIEGVPVAKKLVLRLYDI